jgi:hypothetical protein
MTDKKKTVFKPHHMYSSGGLQPRALPLPVVRNDEVLSGFPYLQHVRCTK